MRRSIRTGFVVLCTPFLVVGCATVGGGNDTIEHMLPAPGFADGWVMDGPVSGYGPETVFDYIDGEAELYFPYGFEAVVTATYVHNGDQEDTVTADIYAMESLFDAFGIYSNYRYAGIEPLPIGAEGYCDGYQLMFYQDRYFMRLSASGNPEENTAVLTACAQAIARALPGDGAKPAELGLLAVPGVDAISVRYIGESLLGYAFFPKGLIGQVALGDQTARAFVVLGASAEAAAQALDEYVAYLREEQANPTIITIPAGDAIAATDPLYKGVTALQSGRYVIGVIGLTDPGDGAAIIKQILARIDAG